MKNAGGVGEISCKGDLGGKPFSETIIERAGAAIKNRARPQESSSRDCSTPEVDRIEKTIAAVGRSPRGMHAGGGLSKVQKKERPRRRGDLPFKGNIFQVPVSPVA